MYVYIYIYIYIYIIYICGGTRLRPSGRWAACDRREADSSDINIHHCSFTRNKFGHVIYVDNKQ